MLLKDIKYSYADVAIVPAKITEISSRSQCNPFYSNGMLPIFTAPMTSVISTQNFNIFEDNHINAILPRSEALSNRISYAINGKWSAFSLKEFEDIFTNKDNISDANGKIKVLIDIANGHMLNMFELVRKSKEIFGDSIEIMVGNIANPETYETCYEYGVDYVRCSIGNGCGCITSSNVSVHYPMASLIDEIIKVKESIIRRGNIDINKLPKIIADGGIRNYSDVIKALALGADYVMIGSLFSKMLESSAITFYSDDNGTINRVNQFDDANILKINNKFFIEDEFGKRFKLMKLFYGMSSKRGQIDLHSEKIKTSEGIEKVFECEYTIQTWVSNIEDYIKSAMSYTNNRTLSDFKTKCKLILCSKSAQDSINK